LRFALGLRKPKFSLPIPRFENPLSDARQKKSHVSTMMSSIAIIESPAINNGAAGGRHYASRPQNR
jgi:hypothetical protein